MTEFVMLVGIPASGKSTYAEKLGISVHSSDAIRKELFGDENEQSDNQMVFDVLQKGVIHDLENGTSCVYDATNINMRRRIDFLSRIKHIECNRKCVVFAIPVEECKRRNENRERKVPDSVFDKMLRQFQCPYYYEGWDEIKVIGTDNLYDIPLDEMFDFEQDNSHHSLTLGKHLYSAWLFAVNKYDSSIENFVELITACFLHDIGKFYTKDFHNTKGELTEEAHYYGHENYGAYILLCYFSCEHGKRFIFGKCDCYLYIVGLVNWHMRPYLAWNQSEKAKEKDIALIGKEMYDDIMKLHEADVATH